MDINITVMWPVTLIISALRKQNENRKQTEAIKQKPISNDSLPPARLHLLNVSQPLSRAQQKGTCRLGPGKHDVGRTQPSLSLLNPKVNYQNLFPYLDTLLWQTHCRYWQSKSSNLKTTWIHLIGMPNQDVPPHIKPILTQISPFSFLKNYTYKVFCCCYSESESNHFDLILF